MLTLESVITSNNQQLSLTDDEDDYDADSDVKSRKKINLNNDDLYCRFSSQSHDVGEYLQEAVNAPSEYLKKLKSSLHRIDHYIRNEVVSQHDSLLSQSDDVAKLESDLKQIRDRVHMMENHVNRIKNGVVQPFHDFKTKSKQSHNLQLGENLLRSILRIKKLMSQLDDHFHKNKDMVKSALCIQEIVNQINRPEMQLNGITVIDSKRDYIHSVYQQIGDLGKQKLSSGLRSLNQPNIAIGLQVFYNLGQHKLNDIIHAVLTTSSQQCREKLKKALNVEQSKTPRAAAADSQQADGSSDGTALKSEDKSDRELSVKSSLLIRLDKCINHHLFGHLLQIWNLEKVLRKKNDGLSRPYIDLVNDRFTSTLQFWATMIEIIKEELEIAADSSPFLQNILVNEYPQLFRMEIDFYHKVQSTTSHPDNTLPVNQQALLTQITGQQHRQNLIESIGTFQDLFLSKCVDRLQHPLQILFANQETRRIPTVADMRTLWTTFYNELKITEECPHLQVRIAQIIYSEGVQKMVLHLKRKMVAVSYSAHSVNLQSHGHGGDATDKLSGESLVNFRHNLDIYNCIQALYFHIWSLLEHHKTSSVDGIGAPKPKMKVDSECSAVLTKCCHLLYNFNCYALYFNLRVMWFTLISALGSSKVLSQHIHFIAHSILPMVNQGAATTYVLRQWTGCLTVVFMQFLSLNGNLCDEEGVTAMSVQIAQFIKLIRIFEDEFNIDVVHSILMLQQFKRMLTEFICSEDGGGGGDGRRTVDQLMKEHPNLSQYVISQFVLSWISRKEDKVPFTKLIGMDSNDFINKALIKQNFFGLFEFEVGTEKMVTVDITATTKEQSELILQIADELSRSPSPYVKEIRALFPDSMIDID